MENVDDVFRLREEARKDHEKFSSILDAYRSESDAIAASNANSALEGSSAARVEEQDVIIKEIQAMQVQLMSEMEQLSNENRRKVEQISRMYESAMRELEETKSELDNVRASAASSATHMQEFSTVSLSKIEEVGSKVQYLEDVLETVRGENAELCLQRDEAFRDRDMLKHELDNLQHLKANLELKVEHLQGRLEQAASVDRDSFDKLRMSVEESAKGLSPKNELDRLRDEHARMTARIERMEAEMGRRSTSRGRGRPSHGGHGNAPLYASDLDDSDIEIIAEEAEERWSPSRHGNGSYRIESAYNRAENGYTDAEMRAYHKMRTKGSHVYGVVPPTSDGVRHSSSTSRQSNFPRREQIPVKFGGTPREQQVPRHMVENYRGGVASRSVSQSPPPLDDPVTAHQGAVATHTGRRTGASPAFSTVNYLSPPQLSAKRPHTPISAKDRSFVAANGDTPNRSQHTTKDNMNPSFSALSTSGSGNVMAVGPPSLTTPRPRNGPGAVDATRQTPVSNAQASQPAKAGTATVQNASATPSRAAGGSSSGLKSQLFGHLSRTVSESEVKTPQQPSGKAQGGAIPASDSQRNRDVNRQFEEFMRSNPL